MEVSKQRCMISLATENRIVSGMHCTDLLTTATHGADRCTLELGLEATEHITLAYYGGHFIQLIDYWGRG